ncbi:endonuclease [Mucilaginibacter terrenus]|uniref:Endonuclease n=1 Tax=Mucilaginibacter terrenus TaxID=2482727 RepID=A0A3E2NL98_9SPHI|nr:endonuclease/exonuclease/phosphatase family protein [Mucilaginibacter terrenus]RFZ81774.1 endonuclease [Mucilaginibacter terrenus]
MKDSKGLGFFGKVFLWANCALCIALLISYLAPYTDPRKVWVIAFFGLAYPPLLLFNFIMIVYWMVRGRLYFLLSLITVIVGYKILLNNVGFRWNSNEPRTANSNAIRIMTYNAHEFKRYGSDNDISTKHEILQLIAENDPDVLGIQEFYTRKRGQYDMIDSIKKIMKSEFYYFEPFSVNYDQAEGMAIFSRYPIFNFGLIALSGKTTGNQCLFADIQKGDKKIRIYSMHLQSIRFEPEDYKYLGDVSKKGKANMSATKRLGSKLKAAFLKRAEQVYTVKDHAKQCPYPYIYSGDFNDTPASYAVNVMATGMKNTFREKGTGIGRTYNGDFPNYQIDYIMASPHFDVKGYQIIQKKLSDHYPVTADLLLK